jgi:dipeptidase E
MRLLLIGATGSPYFEHCKQEIFHFLEPIEKVGLVSAANLYDEEAYFHKINETLTKGAPPICQELIHIRYDSNWRETLDQVDAVVIPGGNTYALLSRLYRSGLLDVLRKKIRAGLLYIGSSAGANVAGPNILTSNDWNVVGLTHFQSLGLVPFNINPHYVEGASSSAPHSETRAARIQEYHKFWNNPVLGIEESGVLEVIHGNVLVVRKGRVKFFSTDDKQFWLESGENLIVESVMQPLSKGVSDEGLPRYVKAAQG